MATGHILPGYGDPISRLSRVRSTGYPLVSSQLQEMGVKYELGQTEFDRIRSQARQMWSRRDREPTTYQFYHYGRKLTQDEISQSRPTSPTRRNNPHPPQVFLTNRLHYIEGYHNADTTMGKPCYRLDASLSPDGQSQRRHIRRKYSTDRPSTALVNTYEDKYGVRENLEPKDAQAAEAWIKLADDKDKSDVMLAVNNYRGRTRDARSSHAERRYLENAPTMVPRAYTTYPALNRWMKQAGAEERGAMGSVLLPPNAVIGYEGEMRARDIDGMRKVKRWTNNDRGDFVMHPDWPPTIPHHRVPCTLN